MRASSAASRIALYAWSVNQPSESSGQVIVPPGYSPAPAPPLWPPEASCARRASVYFSPVCAMRDRIARFNRRFAVMSTPALARPHAPGHAQGMTRPRRCPLLRHRRLVRGPSTSSEDALGQPRSPNIRSWGTHCPAPPQARTTPSVLQMKGALPVLGWQGLEARFGPRGQGGRYVRWHGHVRALEAAERAERSELDVFEQLRPEQRRADAAVEPDVGAPAEVRGVGWLRGMLVRLRQDRRDVVDAGGFRPHDLQPDPVTDRHPVPVPRRAPPLLPGRGHRGVQVVAPGVALKDPVSHGAGAGYWCGGCAPRCPGPSSAAWRPVGRARRGQPAGRGRRRLPPARRAVP